ncbi:MAG TPA: site-2 protease family protein [Terrisporobacter glycolicus]|uniref:Site-2 protease family protein n=1 Tax=Terrisporobacter hibernicus TaxID=2813371 RepID=A0AAX2ZDN3_9FIRM|nr:MULTISPECIES: site-2 protease family protein [Terrisporobacter]MBN9646387.1 site-2 protease family protein [Terrisporobacter glycolicus]UEL46946.1 site-2 protease family protein [Terrisporobacter hibernicus]UPA29430.1 site-2 protease family protein [Terrisporobacter glycolicus]SFJ04917.1 Zn-dependent protease (includes SpoIVFB) [Terrisporobacter glycolicus]HBI94496.1 site-2 protease family protein [Terrisporobacter hibernicus]
MFNLSDLLASLVGIAIAISIHEFGHAYSAHLLGDDTAKYDGRMTLNPAKHVDPLGLIMLIVCHFGWAKPVPVNPNNFKNYRVGNIIVSLSGALGNLIGAIVCALIVKYSDMYAIQLIFDNAMWINIGFGAFNLLPIPPLDGWGVISSLLPYKYNEFIYKYENIGYVVLLIALFTKVYTIVTTPIMMAFYAIVSIFM